MTAILEVMNSFSKGERFYFGAFIVDSDWEHQNAAVTSRNEQRAKNANYRDQTVSWLVEMMRRTANENAACLRRICKSSDISQK